jgi:hypothetical protein
MSARWPIDKALINPKLLGAALGDPTPWAAWRAVLRAAHGLSLSDEDAAIFRRVAGDRDPPTERVREFWAVVGRRGGKSRMAAALAVYQACFVQHRLAAGEVGYVLVLAASRDQTRRVFDYALAFLRESPVLRQEIEDVTRGEIRLKSGVIVAVHSNSYRTVRGSTLLACIFDEVAFWRDESSATPDREVYRAVLPALATTGGMLIGISSPYRKVGLLHAKHRDHFGADGDDVLVVQGPSVSFNPLLSSKIIAQAHANDPEAAASEWQAEFRSDVAAFLDDETIEAAVDRGRPLELPPRSGVRYHAFVDPSGGRGDAYTLCIGHRERDTGGFVADVVRGTRPPFDPVEVTRGYAALCQEYKIRAVHGDNYSAEWAVSAFRDAGLRYVLSDWPKSQLYLEALPLFTRGAISLPDHAQLLRELRLLERQTHRSGRDTVDHGRRGSDDHANALCGCATFAARRSGYDSSMQWVSHTDGVRDDPAAVEREQARVFQRARLHAHIARFAPVRPF